jgi:hypothetical protein
MKRRIITVMANNSTNINKMKLFFICIVVGDPIIKMGRVAIGIP